MGGGAFSVFGILSHNISIQVSGQRLEGKSPRPEKRCGESWSAINSPELLGISQHQNDEIRHYIEQREVGYSFPNPCPHCLQH